MELQNIHERDKLTVVDGFLICPQCRRNRHLLRVPPDSEGTRIRVFCRNCKTEVCVDLHEGQCFESRRQ